MWGGIEHLASPVSVFLCTDACVFLPSFLPSLFFAAATTDASASSLARFQQETEKNRLLARELRLVLNGLHN